MPIENSTEGTVHHTLDMFMTSPLKICGEVELAIRHHLMGRMRSLEDVRRVCAHGQALAQCRATLDTILPGIEKIAVSSNAEGARRARDELGTAAIASEVAAQIYGLESLVAEIEDRHDNTTRFHIVGRALLAPSGRDRTTILMSDRRYGIAGSVIPAARAARAVRGQHDADRVTALPSAEMALRLLRRPGRSCG